VFMTTKMSCICVMLNTAWRIRNKTFGMLCLLYIQICLQTAVAFPSHSLCLSLSFSFPSSGLLGNHLWANTHFQCAFGVSSAGLATPKCWLKERIWCQGATLLSWANCFHFETRPKVVATLALF